LAQAVAEGAGVSAAIDLSDGLAGDLQRLCEASGVGALLEEAALPADPELARAAQALGVDALTLVLGPSDDYELLLAVDPAAREAALAASERAGVPLTAIGRLTDPPGMLELREAGGDVRGTEASGYDPFAGPG
jgi:thiamine-monophosphate kinase